MDMIDLRRAKNRFRFVVWILLIPLFLAGCASSSRVEPGGNKYDKLLQEYIGKSGAVGGVLYILKNGDSNKPEILAKTAAGFANLNTKRAARPTDLFRYASTSKTYIAMLTVKAHTESKIHLDDPLTAYFPNRTTRYLPEEILTLLPNAKNATWRTILNHTCSIYDYRDVEFTRQLLANPFIPRVNEVEQLEMGLTRGLESGKSSVECDSFYSNSNYVVVGLMLDRLYGEHHSLELQRVLESMKLYNTYYEKHYQLDHHPDLEHLSHSYVDLPGRDELMDVTWADDGYGFANGGLIGTPADLARFYSIVFSDQVAHPMKSLQEKQKFLEEMTSHNETGLSLGSVVSDGYFSHGGTIGGHSSIALYSRELRTAIVFYNNDATRHGSMRYDITNEVKLSLEEGHRSAK